MSLSMPGDNTSAVEITNISNHGVWMPAHDHEMFMPYAEFPWFREQSVAAIVNVEEPSPGHYCWPDIDVDLTDEIIEDPQRFPKVAGGKPNQ